MAGHVVEVDESTLGLLIDGQLPWDDVHHIQSSYKDPKRFDTYVKVLQARVSWTDPIVLPISPYLSIVRNTAGVYAVKCLCGHDFGDYRHNWKRSALMNVRDTQEKRAVDPTRERHDRRTDVGHQSPHTCSFSGRLSDRRGDVLGYREQEASKTCGLEIAVTGSRAVISETPKDCFEAAQYYCGAHGYMLGNYVRR